MRSVLLLTWIGGIAATCNFITQQPNQYCHDLAQRCKISDDDFFKYNPNIKKDCSNLTAGQKVCCNAGGLAPSPGADGRCAVYEVKSGDNCGTIGGQYGLTIEQIDNFNLKNSTSFGGTWGFRGCQNLQPGRICVSKGDKGPIPALQKDAQGNPVVCGPTASGNGTNVKCPLNACCNEWGQCGLTPEFCDTVPNVNPGVKGCQDNCGMEYKPNSPITLFPMKIAYYESWNSNRPCQTMNIDTLQSMIYAEKYTHVHYAFGVISDYNAVVNDTETWQKFLNLNGVKKVLSFGGWAFSTEDGTRPIFGDAVLNEKFANSVVNMINKYNLDGIDIDWEYPGATDLKGWAGSTPTVHSNDGENYLKFLKMMKSKMPKDKTLSIAAPASYWYLKNFPIKDMSSYLDYIVYMTYDLHGQWDLKIPSLGPKLLSHVNMTETVNALTMIITKADVPSNKVVMGVASYGRAFWQSDPNCSGPDCTFTDHGATIGTCTQTSGYLSYGEIQEIVNNGTMRKMYYDKVSESDIMLYNTNDWIAYTNLTTSIHKRYTMVSKMALGGTVEWAVDLRGNETSLTKGKPWKYAGIMDVELPTDISNCPKDIKTLDDVDNIKDTECISYGMAQALYKLITNATEEYDKIMSGDEDYDYLYSKKYLPYAIKAANKKYNEFWDTAFITDNGYDTYFKQYIQCKGSCDDGGEIKLKKPMTDLVKEVTRFADGVVYDYTNATYSFPYTFDDGDTIKYTNFPFINQTSSFPDPAINYKNNMDTINSVKSQLKDALDDPDNVDFDDLVDATMHVVVSAKNAVDGMDQVIEVGEKIIEEEEKEALKFFLEIILSIVEIVVAFIPDVGPILSAAISISYSAATGDTDPMDYVIAAAGAIGDIGVLYKEGKTIAQIADLTRELRIATKGSSLRFFDNDARIIRMDKILDKDAKSVISGLCRR